MKNDFVKIHGIMTQTDLDSYSIQYPFKEISRCYDITIPGNKINIESISQVFLKPEVTQYKHAFTQGKDNIFLEGFINIKVFFKNDISSKNTYSTEFKKPICELLPISSNRLLNNLKPTIFIEEALINHINKKRFSLSILMLICTIIDEQNQTIVETTDTQEKTIETTENNQFKNNEHPLTINVEYDMNS